LVYHQHLSTFWHQSVALLAMTFALTIAHPAWAKPDQMKVLVLGDSISAAYGMNLEQGWATLLEQRLNKTAGGNIAWQVINASISGDTTGGGLQRLPKLLAKHTPQLMLVELGGNDGLRGYPINQLRENLEAMVTLGQGAGARVLLLAMEIPPNLGGRYTQLFRDSFTVVAEATDAGTVPFILEGIATRPELMQSDGIHPTAAAQPMILDNIWPHLVPLVEELESNRRD
jgi:acyl-CoA thioesterase-1